VNGQLRQQMSTARMVYPIAEQIAYLSSVMTLEPGDLLATGTSSGAGWGMDPPVFLQQDDVVRVEIDGLGHIENTVVNEPQAVDEAG
jgi:2-keto-4-pentenoate hydratase/2-oxohepta-3-ene-1,7-dioic acid hydratase in catechol pathway